MCNIDNVNLGRQIFGIQDSQDRASLRGRFLGVWAAIRSYVYTDAKVPGPLTKHAQGSSQKIPGAVKAIVEGPGDLVAKVVIGSCRAAWEVAMQAARAPLNAVNGIFSARRGTPETVAAKCTTAAKSDLNIAAYILGLMQSGRKATLDLARLLLVKVGTIFGVTKVKGRKE